MYWLPILVVIAGCTHAQMTAQSSVAPELRECYLNPLLMNRNNLPPSTIQVLIDIIQKIEDNPNESVDLRQMSALLLHTYRQDGIEYHQPEIQLPPGSNVLPYAPTFHSFHRHRLLLTRLIPSNRQVLENTILKPSLKCAFHHMLSTTVDARVRGDENSCNQLSQYRSLRTARSVDDDVEILNLEQMKSATHGNMRQYNPNDDVEYSSYDGEKSEKQLLGQSQCPLQDGVVSTEWGAVSMGHVIAGIAAGAQLQRVPVSALTKGSVVNYNNNNAQQTVMSIYPATLSGDLAEAVLIQGTERGSPSISIGTAGNWNSSQAHRHFMLHNRVNVEMTDPEIRGDIDGFCLGSIVNKTLDNYNSLKLSQLLDMYYFSRNGVYNKDFRASNRRSLSQQHIKTEELTSETNAFAAALDTNMPLRGTIIGGLEALVTSAVNNFQTYSENNLNDRTSDALAPDYRLKTNLYIAIDSSWQYTAVYPAISYLLDGIEVGKFGSSVTILNAFDGSVVINTTFSQADFHSEYTLLKHQSMPTGVDLQTGMTNIRLLMQQSLGNETLMSYVGGNSTVLLFLLNSGNIQNNEAVFEQARQINDSVPDLRILFATSSNQFDNLWNLVRDMHNDIKTVALTSTGTNVEIVMGPVLERIRQVGRRIINPVCGSTFTSGSSGTRMFNDYVEPGSINFYAVSPNYFWGQNDNRKVRISRSNTGVGSLVVCRSRSVVQPRSNFTAPGVDENAVACETLAASGNVDIGLQNPCNGVDTVNTCSPLYLSVQSNAGESGASNAVCIDNAVCRFPYNIRYQVQIEEFSCYSGAGSTGASLAFILSAFLITFLRNL